MKRVRGGSATVAALIGVWCLIFPTRAVIWNVKRYECDRCCLDAVWFACAGIL